MAVYFKHKHIVTQNIPYKFTCEQCHQDSGTLTAEFKAEASRELMTKRPLTSDEKTQLDQDAAKKLKKQVHDAMENAKRAEISDRFKDTCPHCGKPQSWALKGMQHLPGSYALIGAFLTALLCIAINVLGIASFSFGTGLIATLVIALIAMLVGFIQVGAKKSKTKNVQQRELPIIQWPDTDWDTSQ